MVERDTSLIQICLVFVTMSLVMLRSLLLCTRRNDRSRCYSMAGRNRKVYRVCRRFVSRVMRQYTQVAHSVVALYDLCLIGYAEGANILRNEILKMHRYMHTTK